MKLKGSFKYLFTHCTHSLQAGWWWSRSPSDSTDEGLKWIPRVLIYLNERPSLRVEQKLNWTCRWWEWSKPAVWPTSTLGGGRRPRFEEEVSDSWKSWEKREKYCWTAVKKMRRAGIHQWKNLKPDWILSAQENSTLTWNPSWDNDVINAQANMKDVPTDVTHEIKSQNEPLLSIISIMWILKLAKYTQRSRKQICTFWFSTWRTSQTNELKDL